MALLPRDDEKLDWRPRAVKGEPRRIFGCSGLLPKLNCGCSVGGVVPEPVTLRDEAVSRASGPCGCIDSDVATDSDMAMSLPEKTDGVADCADRRAQNP